VDTGTEVRRVAMAMAKLIFTAVRYGVKYGPRVLVVADQLKEPAQDYAKKAVERRQARRTAIAKARTLTDGMLLRQLHGDQPVWIVFSGDEPVAAYPELDVPMGTLLEKADLTRRVRPEDLPTPRDRAVTARDRAIGSVRRKR
jgi:hypothetical protein